jgi:hypothetical protein
MMVVKANFFSINGVCPLDQRRKVGEEEREMKGDFLGPSPGLDPIMATEAAPFGLLPHNLYFSSALQKVEARGAKVLVPPDGVGMGIFWLPKAIRSPEAWAVWHDDPKTERDTRLPSRGLLQERGRQEADARYLGTVGLPGDIDPHLRASGALHHKVRGIDHR